MDGRSVTDDHTGQRVFWVPVKESDFGTVSLRLGRLPEGERVGVAFSTRAELLRAFGPRQKAIRLSVPALRAMLAPLGVTRIRFDVLGVLDPAVLSLDPGVPVVAGRAS
jgi:hypothetical protein